jgi:hypothetical protein
MAAACLIENSQRAHVLFDGSDRRTAAVARTSVARIRHAAGYQATPTFIMAAAPEFVIESIDTITPHRRPTCALATRPAIMIWKLATAEGARTLTAASACPEPSKGVQMPRRDHAEGPGLRLRRLNVAPVRTADQDFAGINPD